ncbi:MAG: response regulator [Elusimicrobia bacterium]|nr:response regulator [Elusimicrobiota bacterium]
MIKKKILVADDDPNILELVRTNLTAADYEVITCNNGEVALRKINEEKPDLLILDVMMPKIDGYTLDLELNDEEETAKIPVIVITGRSDTKKLFDKTKSAKFVAWIEKPFEIKELIDLVNTYFKKAKSCHKVSVQIP